MTIAELIAKLESGEAGEEMDLAIAEAVLVEGAYIAEHCVGDPPLIWHDPRWHKQEVPRFTSSLDAALMLVPEGWFGRVEPRFFEPRTVRWVAYAIRPDWQVVGTPLDRDGFKHTTALAATPALATAAAALKARSAA